MTRPIITVAENAGFCPGVKRAVEMLESELAAGSRVYCLGSIIHNDTFNASLSARGVTFIDASGISEVPDDGVIFIRAHGETREVYAALDARGVRYVDATCPYVVRLRNIVAEKSLGGGTCVILGDANHPEVKGIASFADKSCTVAAFSDAEEALGYIKEAKNAGKRVFAVSQTTSNTEIWKFFANNLKILYTNAEISDTICSVTEIRQTEAAHLAAQSDMTVTVGSRSSSNTVKLFEAASRVCPRTIFAENAESIVPYLDEIGRCGKIAIIAGASTPDVIIQEVKAIMTDTINEELSFEELLNQSLKTLNTGEKVTGTILAVTPAEIKVDVGTKHTGILPYDEISAEGSVDMTQFHVGDSIEAVCTKFSDSEGIVMLSKRRLEEARNAGAVADAAESGEILHGTVREIVKGGVIVAVGGVRVFVPAGQCGSADLETLKNAKVPLKIIEYSGTGNRKRAVGSIRTARKAERKQVLEAFYDTLEVGMKFTGTVRSITSYGAFVNLGPTDGMVHVTEMFWGRPKNPADLFKVGDTIEVFIKDFDRERERISLGYKTEETNPWNQFLKAYKVGDVVNVTVVNLMPFGAFAEIIPGVDGLIHCSQISEKFVPNPASVLKIGDKLDVMITAIDVERTRISLSAKALLDPSEVPEEAVEAQADAE